MTRQTHGAGRGGDRAGGVGRREGQAVEAPRSAFLRGFLDGLAMCGEFVLKILLGAVLVVLLFASVCGALLLSGWIFGSPLIVPFAVAGLAIAYMLGDLLCPAVLRMLRKGGGR